MSKISTTDIPQGGGVPKLIQPGNVEARILSLYLDRPSFFVKGEYNLVLFLETPPPSDDFEGFFIDKDHPESGRHSGQIGRVKAGEYAFSDGETKTGMKVSRDKEILKFLQNLCTSLGAEKWFHSQDKQHDTIEGLVEAMDRDKPYEGILLNWCIAGKEYDGKNGYKNYDLYLPRWSKDGVAYEAQNQERSKLYAFDREKHVKVKKAPTTVSSFEAGNSNGDLKDKDNSFNLD